MQRPLLHLLPHDLFNSITFNYLQLTYIYHITIAIIISNSLFKSIWNVKIQLRIGSMCTIIEGSQEIRWTLVLKAPSRTKVENIIDFSSIRVINRSNILPETTSENSLFLFLQVKARRGTMNIAF
jgi:hypothetical protein